MYPSSLRRYSALALFVALLVSGASGRVVHADVIPSPWAGRDIGSPAIAGHDSFDPARNAFTIAAAGDDI